MSELSVNEQGHTEQGESLDAAIAAHNRAVIGWCLIGIAGVVVLSCLVAAMVRGWQGLLGALLGCAIVLAFFGIDLVAYRLTRDSSPVVVMATMLGSYVGKIIGFGIVVVVLVRTVTFDHSSFAFAGLAVIVAVVVAGITAVARLQISLVGP